MTDESKSYKPQRVHKMALTCAHDLMTQMADAGDSRADILWRALAANTAHPQVRTRGFHKFCEAPIHEGPVTRRFEHMSDERVAFRLGFILEEFKEILRDGFGIMMRCEFLVTDECSKDVVTMSAVTESLFDAVTASNHRDVVEVVDGLGDLNVVVNGFALELGVNMNAVDVEICASNFTKMGEDGNPIIADGTNGPVGKVLKGPHFMKPNIAGVLKLED